MMREDLEYPRLSAIRSVLEKIGVDPSTRYDQFDQDHEYTTCRVEELEDYLRLYEEKETDEYEKRVLGCYLLECLNEHYQSKGSAHPIQERAFRVLHSDMEIHEEELEGWADTSDPDPANWWPITEEIQKWREAYQAGSHNSEGFAPSA